MHTLSEKSNLIKEKALSAGFDAVGITKPVISVKDKELYYNWLKSGYHADMQYMENNIDKRLEPGNIFENTKSIIVLLKSYYHNSDSPSEYNVSKYAQGKDYHKKLKKRLKYLKTDIEKELGEFRARPFVDSAPVLERSLAVNAGLGWTGKNTCLINKDKGSFFFIAELFTDLELEFDQKHNNSYCGKCTKCIDSCPTDALTEKGLDSNKCISYHTIENKGEIPPDIEKNLNYWIFGCDICQNICPFNKNPLKTNDSEFYPGNHLNLLTEKNLKKMTDKDFKYHFAGTPFLRTGRIKLINNIKSAEKYSQIKNRKSQ